MANFSIPLGFKYRFAPEDHELIAYLSCKANGKPLPSEGVIKEIDLYRMNDPGKLFQGSQEDIVYVFTRVKKVSENGKRVDRKVTGNRTWKGLDKGHPIFDKEGFLVGEKKNFNLINNMKMKVGYNMTEFVLDTGSLRSAKFKDYVLCQIKRKVVKGRSAQEEDICGSKAAIEEDVNSLSIASSVNLMPENSLVNATLPFTQSTSEQYFSQDLLVTNVVTFPQSVSEQYSYQNSLVNDAIPLPEPAELYCQFPGLQEGNNSEEIASVVVFNNGMMDAELFVASPHRMNNSFPEFASNQTGAAEHSYDLEIWGMINELTSSSPSVPLYDYGMLC
jgi:hypothetical protein